MTRDGADHTWAIADQLERLLLNARGAIQHVDSQTTDAEFQAALLMATAQVIVAIAAPRTDVARHVEQFARAFAGHMRERESRSGQNTLTERLMAAYDGPDVA